ncbi:helix-turn-helix domain-containing protein [Dictyobacter arantiisoli]|nr:helix-turn-helix domain-containing protein [Dictyobacter arantiisoli]
MGTHSFRGDPILTNYKEKKANLQVSCRFALSVKPPVERVAGLQVSNRSNRGKIIRVADREDMYMPRKKNQQLKQNESVYTPLLQPTDLQQLTITQTMALLSLGRSKVYDLIKREGLPTTKIGSSTRIPLLDLKNWIEQHKTTKLA